MLAFSLLGPFNETYQTALIGYNLLSGPEFGTDEGAPKNIGQGYRWNTKVAYYAYDASFIEFFGTNGVQECDKAFAIFNSLSNVDSYSADLHELPLDTTRMNHTAEQFGLLDLKSTVMWLITEQLGLENSVRFVFALHDRGQPTGSVCPNYDYDVIMRNYDVVSDNYSPYVNGVLYVPTLQELCAEMYYGPGQLCSDGGVGDGNRGGCGCGGARILPRDGMVRAIRPG